MREGRRGKAEFRSQESGDRRQETEARSQESVQGNVLT
jgi:hypothetical protein